MSQLTDPWQEITSEGPSSRALCLMQDDMLPSDLLEQLQPKDRGSGSCTPALVDVSTWVLHDENHGDHFSHSHWFWYLGIMKHKNTSAAILVWSCHLWTLAWDMNPSELLLPDYAGSASPHPRMIHGHRTVSYLEQECQPYLSTLMQASCVVHCKPWSGSTASSMITATARKSIHISNHL